MQFNVKHASRVVAATGLFVVGAMLVDGSVAENLVATKWKVRPSAQRNYRRFYRNAPPMEPAMPYYGEGEPIQEIQGVIEQAPELAPPIAPPEELPRKSASKKGRVSY